MDKNSILVPLLSLILGGGLAGTVVNLVKARNDSKKAPAERDSVIVTSAESAVVIMQKVLDSTNRQLRDKEKEVEELTSKLSVVKKELGELTTRCKELEDLLNLFMDEHHIDRPKRDSDSRG